MPWTARTATKTPGDSESPPTREESAYTSAAAMKTLRRPSRSVARPPSSRNPAVVTT